MLMNKSDKRLLLILVVLIVITCLIIYFTKSNNPKNALVYYKDNLVLTIDLSTTGIKEYTVSGELGNVIIEKNNEQIRVISENSPNHTCSKQGYIKESYEMLICLPNKVVIKIEDKDNVDTIVK